MFDIPGKMLQINLFMMVFKCKDKIWKHILKRVYNEKFGGSIIVSNAPYGSGTVVLDVILPIHWAAILYLIYFRFR